MPPGFVGRFPQRRAVRADTAMATRRASSSRSLRTAERVRVRCLNVHDRLRPVAIPRIAMATPFPTPPQRAATASTRGIVDHLLSALADMRRLAIDHLELCTLEARRAALTLVAVIAVAFGVAVLAMTTWMALVSIALVAWTNAGHGWTSGLALAALVHAGTALGLVAWIRSRLPRIAFPATVRQMRESLGERR